MQGFGPHLIYDGYGCPSTRLSDLGALYRLLDVLPGRIGMTKIMPPYVFRHERGTRGDGLSGFVLIAESHISVHSFPDRGFVNMDIFSCTSFDVGDALVALKDALRPRRVEWKLLDRGVEFPKQIAAARALVSRDRRALNRHLGLEATR